MDWSRLSELRQEVGDEALAEVVALFLEETDAAAERLRAATPADGLADDMHFLKGAALNIGFDELAQMCATAERATLPVDTAPILDCYARTRAALIADAPQLGLRL
jgi:HPt (histidine-containing phosphotransfer) domain-containing protein